MYQERGSHESQTVIWQATWRCTKTARNAPETMGMQTICPQTLSKGFLQCKVLGEVCVLWRGAVRHVVFGRSLGRSFWQSFRAGFAGTIQSKKAFQPPKSHGSALQTLVKIQGKIVMTTFCANKSLIISFMNVIWHLRLGQLILGTLTYTLHHRKCLVLLTWDIGKKKHKHNRFWGIGRTNIPFDR